MGKIRFYDNIHIMKSKFVQILLLCAMTFNILHASIMTEACSHESHIVDVEKQSNSNICGESCDMHHLFHLSAIITAFSAFVLLNLATLQPDSKHLGFHPLFYENAHKPPIV